MIIRIFATISGKNADFYRKPLEIAITIAHNRATITDQMPITVTVILAVSTVVILKAAAIEADIKIETTMGGSTATKVAPDIPQIVPTGKVHTGNIPPMVTNAKAPTIAADHKTR